MLLMATDDDADDNDEAAVDADYGAADAFMVMPMMRMMMMIWMYT